VSARRLRWLPLLIVPLWLAGCSLAQFAYNRIDVLARWELSSYVDLDPQQQALFDREFRKHWDWHRRNELPLYVQSLRALADAEEPPDRETLDAIERQYRARMTSTLRAVGAIACALGPTFSDEQVAEFLAAIDEDVAEYAETYVEPSPERQRQETERQLRKHLARWFGNLSSEQRTLIRTWTARRELTAEAWLAYRRAWRDALAVTLADRAQPSYCERVTTLMSDAAMLWTSEQKAAFDRNREQWLDLFGRLGATLSPAQRAHAKERILALANDFERLAAEATPAPVP
jgi:hypothetical protein